MSTKFVFFLFLNFSQIFTIFTADPQKRHIIFILVDDWGWGDFGIHGLNLMQTPNMDALAYSGVILHNYYTASACTPSRAALMTGFHQVTLGMQHRLLLPGHPYGLPLQYKLMPQYLKDEGYKTYAVGKWHLGSFKANYTPTSRGFDYHFGSWEGMHSYYHHEMKSSSRTTNCYDMRRGMNVSWDSYGKYVTDLFTNESLAIIENHDTSIPMFLYLAHTAVHTGNNDMPFEAPPDIVKKFQHIQDPNLRTFAAMVWKLDDSVGKIIAALGDKKMLSDSIIVLTGDNGASYKGYDEGVGSSWPLRGAKFSQWEGGVRGNAAIWARDLPPSKIENHLMHLQDWVPTLLGAINSTQLENTKFDGHNLWPVLKGEEKSIYDDLLLQADPIDNLFAYRNKNYKILHGSISNMNKWYHPGRRERSVPDYNVTAIEGSLIATTFRTSNITFPSTSLMTEIRKNLNVNCSIQTNEEEGNTCDPAKEYCLFDIQKDPCERNNLAKHLKTLLDSLIADMKKYNVTPPLNVHQYDIRSNPTKWNLTCINWCDYVPCIQQ